MIPETQAATFLDCFGYRGNCKTCQEPVWWLRNKKGVPVMYVVALTEHKHSAATSKPDIRSVVRDPGGEVK